MSISLGPVVGPVVVFKTIPGAWSGAISRGKGMFSSAKSPSNSDEHTPANRSSFARRHCYGITCSKRLDVRACGGGVRRGHRPMKVNLLRKVAIRVSRLANR